MGVKFGIETEDGEDNLPEVSRVEVLEQLGETITYTVVFAEDVCDGDFKLLKHPAFSPCKEISIWVEVEEKRVFLVKGPVKGQQIKLVNGGQGSELQVKGTDNSIKMKLKEKKHKHKSKDHELIAGILDGYGFDPAHQKVVDHGLDNEESHHERLQTKDDLSFLKSVAQECGAYFWISYDDDGNEIANFNALPLGKTEKKGDKPFALIINGEDETNIDELSISWDTDVPSLVKGQQIETKQMGNVDPSVDSPPQDKLGEMTLAIVTDKCRQEMSASPRPSDNTNRSQKRSEGALNEAEWFIKASCSTSFDRICHVLHAHTVVEIHGAGSMHSGRYVVSGVTHTIDVSSYKMQIELMRNAWSEPKEKNGLPSTGM